MTNIIFITFSSNNGTSSSYEKCEFHSAANRLIVQAKASNYFNRVIHYTDDDLQNDTEFWEKHGEFITKNPRGYGYWLWRSYLIKKTFEKMNNGDILMYLDSGCEIGGRIQHNIPYFFELVKKEKIIATDTYCSEKEWCKMDLFLHLNMNKNEYINSTQFASGALLFCKCDVTKDFVDLWYSTNCNYHLIDDSPSVQPNFDGFKENRHEQAVLSLLLKKYNICPKNTSLCHCIHYIRNKTGVSRLR
jgi:hypothetical protein